MTDFIVAIGLVLVIEGGLYALFPEQMKAMMAQLLSAPLSSMRIAGLVAAVFGVVLVWFVRG